VLAVQEHQVAEPVQWGAAQTRHRKVPVLQRNKTEPIPAQVAVQPRVGEVILMDQLPKPGQVPAP